MISRGLSIPHRGKSQIGLLSALPAWVFYFLMIGMFAIAWGTARLLLGISFFQTLVLLILPFGLLIWLRDNQSADRASPH